MRQEHLQIESDSMPEAEVTLRLAFWLLDQADQNSHADIAIDGAHVRIAAHQQAGRQIDERSVFDIQTFLATNKWLRESRDRDWRGSYSRNGQSLTIKSIQGFDVQVRCDGKEIKAECKGGRLQRSKGLGPTAILASAIGQLIVSSSTSKSEELWAAVPDSPRFESAGTKIVRSRAFVSTGIRIALVGKNGVRLLDSN